MSVSAVLVTDDPAVRERVENLLRESEAVDLGSSVHDLAELEAVVARGRDVGVVLVDANLDGGQGHVLARRLGLTLPLLGSVMLVEDAGPDELAAAMEVGARSVVSLDASLDELVSRLESVAAWTRAATSASGDPVSGTRHGRVVAVAGAKGGVGSSVLTLLLALARRASGPVTAVDFDLGAGDLAPYLGVCPRKSLVDLAPLAGEVSGRVLRETTYQAPGGIRLVPAPEDGEHAESMSAETARAVVHALRFECDLAVVDVGTGLDEPRAVVLEQADAVVLVVTPDLPALRAARRTLDQWERLAVRRRSDVRVVLNRWSKRSEVTAQVVQQTLRLPVAAVVPEGGSAFETAVNTVDLVATRTAVHARVAEVALRVVGSPGAPQGPPDEKDGVPVRGRAGARRGRGDRREGRRGRRPGPDVTEPEAVDAGGSRESGQAAVELPVLVAFALVVFLLCAQGVLWAGGLVAARGAADEGSRLAGIQGVADEDDERRVRERARDAVPEPWGDDVEVAVVGDEVVVTLGTPTVIPGLTLRADARSAIVGEPS